MGVGAVTNHHLLLDAKIKHAIFNIDLATDYTTLNLVLLFDPDRKLVIEDITFVWTEAPTAAGAAPSTVNIGTLADEDAVVDAEVIGDAPGGTSDAIGDENSLTLASTLAQASRHESRGKPVLPAATPLLWDSTATGATGMGAICVTYFPLDRESGLS